MPEPKVFLQNKLARSRARLAEIGPQIESKRREVSGLDNLTQAYSKNEALGDADEVMEVGLPSSLGRYLSAGPG